VLEPPDEPLAEPFNESEEEPEPELEAPREEAHEVAYQETHEETYEETYQETYGEAYERDETFDAGDLPDAPRWPQWGARERQRKGEKQSKASLFARVRKQGEGKPDPYGTKRRGVIAQMLDPQVDSIKGLPPMVDPRDAFQKPTYPAPRWQESEDGGSSWDEDT